MRRGGCGFRFQGGLLLVLAAAGCNNQVLRKSPGSDVYSAAAENQAPALAQSFGFYPKRVWRLTMSWDPDPFDRKRAFVNKDFQLFVADRHGMAEFEKEIARYGGDSRYLAWLDSNVDPLTASDTLVSSRISRLQDSTVATLSYRSQEAMEIAGLFGPDFVRFPDPVFRFRAAGCIENDSRFLEDPLSVGFEIILKSRHAGGFNDVAADAAPGGKAAPVEARLWEMRGFSNERLRIVERSHLLRDQIVYRAGVLVSSPFARCPLRAEDYAALAEINSWQPMGIAW